MTAPHSDQLIDGYLARLRAAADDLPSSARNELLDDMRTHIAEARSREPEETDATILNILDRLGEPSLVVAEAHERLGLRPASPYGAGLREIAAVVLLPLFWPIGVILLWVSPAWNVRDKVIGTLLPPGGYWGVLLFGATFATAHTTGGCVTVIGATVQAIQNGCHTPAGPSPLETALSIIASVLIYTLPLITAGYLAVRLRWGHRIQAAQT